MTRSRVALVAGSAALVVAVAPALAADHTITASSDVFTPRNLTIAAGDRVLFRNSGGSHNFVFEDGPEFPETPTGPGSAWDSLNRTFTAPGTYAYYCFAHGAPGGVGMAGTITVTAADPSPSPQPSPDPSPTPEPGGGGGGPGGGGTTPAGSKPVGVRALAVAPGTFCARCKRPGARLRIDLSAPARVTGVLKRRARRFGRVDFGRVAAGPRTLRLVRTSSGKRLVAGRYSLALSVDGVAEKPLRFRLR